MPSTILDEKGEKERREIGGSGCEKQNMIMGECASERERERGGGGERSNRNHRYEKVLISYTFLNKRSSPIFFTLKVFHNSIRNLN